jgi:hypothetical protein
MLIKVIFSDGSLGMVKSAQLVALVKVGKIVAYKPFEDWVEVRRTQCNGKYQGPERRKLHRVA